MSTLSGWHREDIKAAVRKRGITLTQLALDNGLSEGGCRRALYVPTPRADRVISKFIDVPLHVLWPQRYDDKGRKLYLKDPTRQHDYKPRPSRPSSSKFAEN